MKGFKILQNSFKEERKVPIKRQPVYNFLKRTLDRADIQKQHIKDATEDFIHSFFLETGIKKIRMISLPGVTWQFEKSLRKRLAMYWQHRIKVSLIGCESDYKVFCLSASKMPGNEQESRNPFYSDNAGFYVVQNNKNMCHLLNADIFDVLNKQNSTGLKYDIAWFDTTNTVISIRKKIQNIGSQMSHVSVLIFTVLKGREHFSEHVDRVEYLSDCISPFGYKLMRRWEYFDTCPMLHLIFTRDANHAL